MTTLAQRSFAAGEIAPSLYARVDNARYPSALRTCRNFMVMRHGGVTNRPGTIFIGEVKDSSKVVRLIPFVFNADQTYVLEFGDQYIRFYREDAQINVSSVTAWSAATNYVIGDLASSAGINYYCIAAHINQAPPNATYWYPLSGTIYEIPTPYADEDLADLQYVQSADVITIVHPSYAPRELRRFAHTNWTLSTITFGPEQADVTALTNDGTPPGAIATSWSVTAVSINGEESMGVSTSTSDTPSSGSPTTLTWTAASGAVEYRVYREFDAGGTIGTGLVGVVTGTTFADTGDLPEAGTPPIDPQLFQSANNYPSAVTYSQQRRIFANSNNAPETAWASRIGSFNNFSTRFPTQDDDPVTFTLVGKQVNEVAHLLELRQLLALTTGSEWAINGNQSGVITPSEINAKQQTFNGSSSLSPLNVNGSALYVQARGAVVRDIAFNYELDAYNGNDITIFSSHLFDQYTLVDWAFQQVPHSIVWAVRSDGTLLGLTYIRDQQMLAWHRHDFYGGTVENVCSVPDGNEDAVYVVIKRTIDGAEVRYIEKMASRQIVDIVDSIFMDSALSYDGRNAGATTMTLSGGTDWDYQEDLTLTASASYFVSGDVGNAIHLTGSDGEIIRATITVFSSDTVVTARANKTVPASLQNVAVTDWSKAVDSVSGLDHLEGEAVSVFADGFVVANPNNDSYVEVVVSGGAITLDKPYSVIHVGLPVTADIQTLDIDTPQGETVADKRKLITKVNLYVEASRGIFAGAIPPSDDDVDPLENLVELKIRDSEDYNDPVGLQTGVVDIPIKSEWNSNGRVFIRQVDPIPLSILAVIPAGLVPFRG